jgi:uncharacterized surface protein with fasciclin (FAS1) repeats
MKPENKKMLQTILTYVVSGKMNAADIAKAIKMGGKATLKQLVVELNRLDEREKIIHHR